MELTQQNLLRVGDIVAEIERNLGSLKRQAAKAERYVAYRGELEDLQLHEASHRYLELAGWIKLEAGEVARWTDESERSAGALAAREAELEALRLDAHAAEEALEKAQNASFAAENDGARRGGRDRAREGQARRAAEARGAGRARELHRDRRGARGGSSASGRSCARGRRARGRGLGAGRAARRRGGAPRRGRRRESGRADAKVDELRHAIAKAQAEIASAEAKLAGFERRKTEMHARVEKMRGERETLEGAQIEHALAGARARAARSIDLKEGKVTSAEEKPRLEERLGELRREIG